MSNGLAVTLGGTAPSVVRPAALCSLRSAFVGPARISRAAPPGRPGSGPRAGGHRPAPMRTGFRGPTRSGRASRRSARSRGAGRRRRRSSRRDRDPGHIGRRVRSHRAAPVDRSPGHSRLPRRNSPGRPRRGPRATTGRPASRPRSADRRGPARASTTSRPAPACSAAGPSAPSSEPRPTTKPTGSTTFDRRFAGAKKARERRIVATAQPVSSPCLRSPSVSDATERASSAPSPKKVRTSRQASRSAVADWSRRIFTRSDPDHRPFRPSTPFSPSSCRAFSSRNRPSSTVQPVRVRAASWTSDSE